MRRMSAFAENLKFITNHLRDFRFEILIFDGPTQFLPKAESGGREI
jgi:hypothetical protein